MLAPVDLVDLDGERAARYWTRDERRDFFASPDEMRVDVAGRPVYLVLGMRENDVARMKPQNLFINLPLSRAS